MVIHLIQLFWFEGGVEENVQLSLPVIAQSIHFLNDSFPRGFLLEEEGQEDTNGKGDTILPIIFVRINCLIKCQTVSSHLFL